MGYCGDHLPNGRKLFGLLKLFFQPFLSGGPINEHHLSTADNQGQHYEEEGHKTSGHDHDDEYRSLNMEILVCNILRYLDHTIDCSEHPVISGPLTQGVVCVGQPFAIPLGLCSVALSDLRVVLTV